MSDLSDSRSSVPAMAAHVECQLTAGPSSLSRWLCSQEHESFGRYSAGWCTKAHPALALQQGFDSQIAELQPHAAAIKRLLLLTCIADPIETLPVLQVLKMC